MNVKRAAAQVSDEHELPPSGPTWKATLPTITMLLLLTLILLLLLTLLICLLLLNILILLLIFLVITKHITITSITPPPLRLFASRSECGREGFRDPPAELCWYPCKRKL